MNMPTTKQRNIARAFSITELIASLAVVIMLIALATPALSHSRTSNGVMVSLANLRALSAAHVAYASDYAGRQYTTAPDNLAAYGSNQNTAVTNWQNAHGTPIPPITIGRNSQGTWAFTNFGASAFNLYSPIGFTGTRAGFGMFRIDNVERPHRYVSDKFFSREYYPPNDTHVYGLVQPALDVASSFYNFGGGSSGGTLYWCSYVRSPAALFNPQVLRRPSQGGFIDPWSINTGVNAPPLHAAKYPDLKTHIIEHHWNQNPPADICNPVFEQSVYNNCEPYYFNHGIESSPAALFYDGHVRLLPNTEVQASDQTVLAGTGGIDGLWSRDTPFGSSGYFLNAAYDDIVDVSHHILTTDGILGRDTLGLGTVSEREAVWRPKDRKRIRRPAPGSVRDISSPEVKVFRHD